MGRCHAPKIAEAMAVASYSKDDNRILLLMEDYVRTDLNLDQKDKLKIQDVGEVNCREDIVWCRFVRRKQE